MTRQITKIQVLMLLVIFIVGMALGIVQIYNADKTINVTIGYDYPVAFSLTEMTKEADLIVMGRYNSYDSSWNMARNPNNVLEEDKDNYTEGHLYSFVVEKVLKGNLDDSDILVNHRYSESHTYIDSNAVTNEQGIITKTATYKNEIDYIVHDPLYIEPDIGSTYILFLTENEMFGHYYGAIEPFSILVKPNDEVLLQSNLINRTTKFEETVVVGKNCVFNVSTPAVSIPDNISNCNLDEIIEQIMSDNNKK